MRTSLARLAPRLAGRLQGSLLIFTLTKPELWKAAGAGGAPAQGGGPAPEVSHQCYEGRAFPGCLAPLCSENSSQHSLTMKIWTM